MSGRELTTVGSPFIDRISDMRWKPVTDNIDEQSAPWCETLREVLIKSSMRKAIERRNRRACVRATWEGRDGGLWKTC